MKKNNYLTLGGLFIALHLLFIFMSRILVGSELILVIFLPLLSTIYSLKFNKKEVAMYFIASFLLCLIFEPIATFIYVLPALIVGTVYGILRKKNFKELSLVYISTMSHFVSLFVSFLSISIMFKEVEFFDIFATFLNKEGSSFYICVYLILMLLGLLEAFCVNIITNNELQKLGYKEIKKEETTPVWIGFAFIVSLIMYIIVSFINPIYTCYIFPFLLAFSIPHIVEFVIINKHKWVYFVVSLFALIGIFIFPYLSLSLYPSLVIFITSPLIFINLFRVLYTFLLKYSNNG